MVAPISIPVLLVSVGMLAGWLFPWARDLFLCGLLASVSFAAAAFFLGRGPVGRFLPLLIPVLMLGAARTSLRLNPRLPEHHLVHRVRDEPLLLEGVLGESPERLAHGTLLPLRCLHVLEEGVPLRATGRVDLFLNGDSAGLQAGDLLLLKARVRRIQDPGNPGAMRTRPRSFLRGVYLRGSVQSPGHIVRLGSAGGYRLWRGIRRVRERLAGFLREGGDSRTDALLKVWLLGDRSYLPEGLRDDFRASGLSHLLALSGLHVGMVFLFSYGFWRFLLGRSVRLLLGGKVQSLAMLLGLPGVLFYVLVAGTPVTAVRAGLMAALVAGAVVLGRVPSLWNGLAAAALFILLGSPAALFSPSFLLSFVTVGVLLIQASGASADTGRETAGGGTDAGRLWACPENSPSCPAGAEPMHLSLAECGVRWIPAFLLSCRCASRMAERILPCVRVSGSVLARIVKDTPLAHKVARGARGILAVSWKASLATAPLTAFFFQTVTPLAFAANLAMITLQGRSLNE